MTLNRINNWDSILSQYGHVSLGKTYVIEEKNKKFTSRATLIGATEQIGLRYKQHSNPLDIQWMKLMFRVYYVAGENWSDDKHWGSI